MRWWAAARAAASAARSHLSTLWRQPGKLLLQPCIRVGLRPMQACIAQAHADASEPLEAVLLKQYPWCAEWKDALGELFEADLAARMRGWSTEHDGHAEFRPARLAGPAWSATVAGSTAFPKTRGD